MKKIILLAVFLFCGTVSSFAYDNGVAVFALPGSFDSKAIYINTYCEIQFLCQYTNTSTPGGYAYLKHGVGGTLIDAHNFTQPYSGSYSSVFTGYWYTLELAVNCIGGSSTTALAELRW